MDAKEALLARIAAAAETIASNLGWIAVWLFITMLATCAGVGLGPLTPNN
jgi:hypothetical protein